MDQRVHVLDTTQELRNSTRNFGKLAVDYLGEERPICLLMGMWPHQIDRFERQYDKAFMRDPLFRADLMDRIHKRVQVFLHYCNKIYIEDMVSGALVEFRGLQKNV